MNRSQALQHIEGLSGKGELEEATHLYALIVINHISDTAPKELLRCHTPEELSSWKRRNTFAWQAKLSEEEFAEQFEVGNGSADGCIEKMLSCIDYQFLVDLLTSRVSRTYQTAPSQG